MPNVQEAVVGKAWNDPQYSGAILAKGQRRAKKPAQVTVVAEFTDRLRCSNCNKFIAVELMPHCVCSIWDRGKRHE